MPDQEQDSGSIPDPNDSPLKLHKDAPPSSPHEVKGEAPLFNVGEKSYQEIAQSLLISMQNARNIENGTTAFMPLANDETRDILLRIAGHAEEIHKLCNSIYKRVAVTAFNS